MTLRFHGAERAQTVRDAVTMQHKGRDPEFHRIASMTAAPPRKSSTSAPGRR